MKSRHSYLRIFMLLSTVLLACLFWQTAYDTSSAATPLTHCVANDYVVTTVTDPLTGNIEYRLFCSTHHFMSVIVTPEGAIAQRPHPGCDPNGWGTTWYSQPFLPGATLRHTTIQTVMAQADGIVVQANGYVSRGFNATYGTWALDIVYSYVPHEPRISGSGSYTIALSAPLSFTTGDLNLYRDSSNYLTAVPLAGGGTGDTGDMTLARASGDAGFPTLTWIPPNLPAHFPAEESDWLSIEVIGQYNTVLTEPPIASAYKPNVTVVLTSALPLDRGISFGAIYDLDQAQNFAADNVGITPLIKSASTDTDFAFQVVFESTPLFEDSCVPTGVTVRDLTADTSSPGQFTQPVLALFLLVVTLLSVKRARMP